MFQPFGEFAPDAADLNAAVLQEATNVLPYQGGYMPMPSCPGVSDGLPDNCCGAFLATVPESKAKYVFAGTPEALWRLGSDLTWEDVSKEATTYNASLTDRWSFAQFGQYVVAVNINDDPQVFDLAGGTEFDDLEGSPPRARLVGIWGDFLVLGSIAAHPNRVQWSGLNTIDSWTPGVLSSDWQDFPDGGWVKAIPSTDPPLILQDAAVRRATFLPGSAAVFGFEKIIDGIGAMSLYGTAFKDKTAFFPSDDGFYAVSTDGSLTKIGDERVNRYFTTNVDPDWMDRTQAIADPVNPRVYWAWRVLGDAATAYSRILIFDYARNRWTEVAVATQAIAPLATPGYTLEELDAFGTLETLPYSLDSGVWAGGLPALGAVTDSGEFGFFRGPNLEARLVTAEQGAADGAITELQTVLPIVNAPQAMVRAGYRALLRDNVVWTQEAAMSANTGIVRLRKRARYLTLRCRIPAAIDWTRAQGLDVAVIGSGRR